MSDPFLTREGHTSNKNHPFEEFLDGCATKPDQFLSAETEGGRGLDGFFSRYTSDDKEAPPSLTLLEIPEGHRPSREGLSRKLSMHSVGGGRAQLSTEEVVKVAAALYIQASALVAGHPTNLRLPFGLLLSSLGAEDLKGVELVGLLLSAAEKVSNEQYNRAKALLSQCTRSSSKYGSAVQRVVYYFCDALQERIDRETGEMSSKGNKKIGAMMPRDLMKAVLTNHPVQLIANNTLPFTQVLHFTAIQALLDSVASARRIHIIDLSIKYGQQWTFFLHGLATRRSLPIESVTISAVGAAEEILSMTGKRLWSFAESLSLHFKFKPVIIPDMKEMTESMFELEVGEVVGIYTSLDMNNLIMRPESLDNVMRVFWKLKPCLVTVIDVEANHNSPSFIKRFTEALFFYGAYFECFDCLMEKSDERRLMIEGVLSQGMKCTVAAEGSERVVRQVGVCVWRAFFRRFGLREADLSEWSMYQAHLLIKRFVEDNSCTLAMNSKALLVGWKGTPLHFVSAWKFQEE
ncbi:uncharacterized protein A4U43_C07F12520 [Asparagus officinalis]|uniref:Uncharacterized protein n=1 Tax=Asparagus officinalis TaxID=4686 RepID=A0A5P1EEG0_ASPOF|nr:DELLA protein RGL2-like [Asparagus officinalis]ONK63209.1 uncharacterized protein A4U43_C07F12520 [Asparagus officinalis]